MNSDQVNVPQYCPLCDKRFDSHYTKAASLSLVKDHMKKKHPESSEYFEEEEQYGNKYST